MWLQMSWFCQNFVMVMVVQLGPVRRGSWVLPLRVPGALPGFFFQTPMHICWYIISVNYHVVVPQNWLEYFQHFDEVHQYLIIFKTRFYGATLGKYVESFTWFCIIYHLFTAVFLSSRSPHYYGKTLNLIRVSVSLFQN